MAFEVILSTLALNELESAVDWYNECEDGLGKRFVEAVDYRLAAIEANPYIFSKKLSGYHEALLEQFPYLVVYKIIRKGKKVHILHIFHTRQNPSLKKK